MEWVYVLLAIVALIVASACVGFTAVNAGRRGPGSKRSYLTLGLAVVFGALSMLAMSGVQSERDKKKIPQKHEVELMGFSAVSVGYINNADVRLRSGCPNRDLHLYKRGGIWYVGTEEIDSSKPVVDEREVADRPEVKWWCSKPPIKN